jgi:hypothetical protein
MPLDRPNAGNEASSLVEIGMEDGSVVDQAWCQKVPLPLRQVHQRE